jgi:hypothetical protein
LANSGFLTSCPAVRIADEASRVLGLQWDAADFQHRGQLNQLRLMLIGMMLAEEKFRARGQLGTHTGGGAAPIAPISPS